ncbi:hypothetical protein PHMEG_00019553 [Phytophthora megakarya]|uniref:Uncharacterized protein n=1 Tax=Phytophthora megakarya TaxID=4795 RepID=A0A225VR20_9STRA|nr:hypothetical protein PHMEG_00019553 [Phytophthora megakarya]
MITRGQEPTDAPASPSPRTTTAPSGNESLATRPDVVDVTDKGEPWTATSARRVSDPPPLRASKRVAISDGTLNEARKAKKKAVKPTARKPGAASHEDGFDLSEFMASFQPGTASVIAPPVTASPLPMLPSPPAVPEGPSVVDELRALKEKFFVCVVLSARKPRRPGTP